MQRYVRERIPAERFPVCTALAYTPSPYPTSTRSLFCKSSLLVCLDAFLAISCLNLLCLPCKVFSWMLHTVYTYILLSDHISRTVPYNEVVISTTILLLAYDTACSDFIIWLRLVFLYIHRYPRLRAYAPETLARRSRIIADTDQVRRCPSSRVIAPQSMRKRRGPALLSYSRLRR